MRVLVVGSGGREHALCWAIAASPLCDALYCAPGNAGISAEATCVPIAVDDTYALVEFARDEHIDIVVVGPEGPLVAGLVDRLSENGIQAFGPTAAAAALEGSKAFMKDICSRYGIPTAPYGVFGDALAAKDYVRTHGAPIVVKADGLAAGKGVVVAETVEEANAAIDAALVDGRFGDAGGTVIVEGFLRGEEVSFFALVDGDSVLPLASAQDHKRVADGDVGPNTGGMGAYSPAPIITPEIHEVVMDRIVGPLVAAMAVEGRPFRGVLFAGLMIDETGPQLLEINTRFGDPECQAILPRLKSDLLPALVAACDGTLRHFDLRWYDDACLCVVMATRGYPGEYANGTEIRGLDAAGALDDVFIFHAGTVGEHGRTLANGGRVLGVTALGADLAAAKERAYAAVDRIDWPEGFCRRDIGWRALGR